MCKEAGIAIRTNNSLRATSATDMFGAGILEKVVQSRAAHRSLKALRMYENHTDEQHTAACSVLIQKENVPPSHVLKPGPEICMPTRSGSQGGAMSGACPLSMFGSVQNCTINMQVYNSSTVGKVVTQGTVNNVQVDSPDDLFVDSLLCYSHDPMLDQY